MKIPFKELLINGKAFGVVPFPNTILADNAHGANSVRRQVIEFLPDQHIDQIKDTILHEVVHVIDYDMQLEMTERQVHCVATGIYSALRSNPKFLDWLKATK